MGPMQKRPAKSNSTLRRLIKEAILKNKSALSPKKGRVSIGWPVFDAEEIQGALDALLEVQISQGPRVREFEDLCAKYVGTKYAIAVNSGSSANLLALSALIASGEVSLGSEVILPATTFATVASPILQVGLIPVYVDVDPLSWNIDPKEVKKAIGPKTRVIMPVHTFGNPADMKVIMPLANKHKLIVLEDCCEAHGAAINGKKVGSFGDLSTLSFFVAHNITTGEGGMLFTNSKKYRNILHSLREFGRLPLEESTNKRFTHPSMPGFDARYIFTRLGYNVRMTDVMASLGIAQIKKLDKFNRKRIATVERYNKALKKYADYLQLPSVERGNFHSFYGYPFFVKKTAPFTRMDLVSFLEQRGIETRPFFGGCLPDQPAFRDEPKRIVGKLPVARLLRDQSVFIGCHPALSDDHVRHVLTSFDEFFTRLPKSRRKN